MSSVMCLMFLHFCYVICRVLDYSAFLISYLSYDWCFCLPPFSNAIRHVFDARCYGRAVSMCFVYSDMCLMLTVMLVAFSATCMM